MDEPWEANATKLFGIPLHPLGEIAFLSYINMRSSRGETPNVEVQNRIMGLHIQLALATMLGTLFAYNLIRLFRHIKAQSYKLSDLCYFLPSFLGINTYLVHYGEYRFFCIF
ncbi:hypothetical protein BDF19DRAFT_455809 [Syncephalis fuscata]|nr:hypothetical protein BDF19DRAFT_455809 [Syncephalis fuscata]